jgi:hypothetical protein
MASATLARQSISPQLVFFWPHSDSTFVVLVAPRNCPACKAAHFFFLNRNGRTLCAVCDALAVWP